MKYFSHIWNVAYTQKTIRYKKIQISLMPPCEEDAVMFYTHKYSHYIGFSIKNIVCLQN